MQVAPALTIRSLGTSTILWNNRVHPGRQILQHPWVGVFVDGEAAAGVETGEMQNPGVDASGRQPLIQLWIEARETLAMGLERELLQHLLHGHGGGLSVVLPRR